jgi:DNA primase large subunit
MKIEVDASDTDTMKRLKDKALMLKTICLDEMGKDPMYDVSSMNKREKVKLQVEVERKWNDMPDPEIIRLFNEICTETIFDSKGMDYEHMPVGHVSRPQLPKEEVERISALPEEEQLRIYGRVLRPESIVEVNSEMEVINQIE